MLAVVAAQSLSNWPSLNTRPSPVHLHEPCTRRLSGGDLRRSSLRLSGGDLRRGVAQVCHKVKVRPGEPELLLPAQAPEERGVPTCRCPSRLGGAALARREITGFGAGREAAAAARMTVAQCCAQPLESAAAAAVPP